MQSPWDDVAISYILVCSNIAKKRYIDAFKEEAQLISYDFPCWSNNSDILQVILPLLHRKQGMDTTCIVLHPSGFEGSCVRCMFTFGYLDIVKTYLLQADLQAKYSNQKAECMEEAARVISKAFTHCMTDR